DALAAKLDLPQRDARDIEQIVHQPHQLAHLAVHHRAHLLGAPRVELASPEEVDAVAQWCERVAQLVAQGAEELVLALVGEAETALDPLDAGQILDEAYGHLVLQFNDGLADRHRHAAAIGADELLLVGSAGTTVVQLRKSLFLGSGVLRWDDG